MNKKLLVEQIRAKLTEEIETLTRAALAAHDAAINEESKAEDQYDTRGLEASYLASAQAQRVAELKRALSQYQQMEFRDFAMSDPIAPTALVELESHGRRSFYFIAPHGGGMAVEAEGVSVQVITPKSPVGEELIGRRAGMEIDVELGEITREFTILSVQ